VRCTVDCWPCSRYSQAVFTCSAPHALAKEREPGDNPTRLSKEVDQDSINPAPSGTTPTTVKLEIPQGRSPRSFSIRGYRGLETGRSDS
jgi:hypothetical protein